MDSLALELIDEIIGHVDETDGMWRSDLLACSLVCRFWVPSSQRRLFRCIKLTHPILWIIPCPYIQQLGQVLLNSPHLVNYIRELRLPDMSSVPPFIDAKPGLDEPLSPLLRKLTHVQKLDIAGLAWNDLPRDLRQSLCQVLELPSMAIVCIDDAQFDCMDDFMNFINHARSITGLALRQAVNWRMSQNPMALEDTQADDNKQRLQRCCISRLDIRLWDYRPASVNWLLGPRSHLDVSHVHTLHIYLPAEAKDDSFNRLLCAIGSSLKHLFISLRYPSSVPIDLAFNVNIETLSLVNRDMLRGSLYTLGKVLSTISASNHIHHMELSMDFFHGSTLQVDLAALEDVYSVLGGPLLQFLRVLRINIVTFTGFDCETAVGVSREMVAAHPLLATRGVRVSHCDLMYSQCLFCSDDFCN
ncbi:hypothetical protein JB92DRAFT_972552 [Gautieria morchelliformis]|nr:hypothetical protein JB92DRAFT_972552 [Gautieria morchelliformis]